MKLKNYLNRTSVKNFTGKKMSDEDVKLFSKVINNSPTSENHQLFSAIMVRDQEMLNWISKKNWNQEHIKKAAVFIVFVADKYRLVKVNQKNKISKNPNTLYFETVKAIVDATIACSYTMSAAIELGYGTTMVGGLQEYGDELNQKLKIPKNAYAVLGLSIGYIKSLNKIKPKVKKVFLENYDKEKSYKDFIKYDKETYEEFSSLSWKKMGIIESMNWTSSLEKNFSDKSPYVRSSKYFEKMFKK